MSTQPSGRAAAPSRFARPVDHESTSATDRTASETEAVVAHHARRRRFARDLRALEAATFDVLIVGGGITGACVARDAAMRGLQVALIEQHDFAGSTSSNSMRIVHGGLRYLSRLQLGTAREAIRERSTWLGIAPHLVHPLPVLVPLYGRGAMTRHLLRALLIASDALAADRNRGLSPERQLPGSRVIGREECLELAPYMETRRLTGGLLFYDAQLYNSERLTLEVLRAAFDAGAVVANYVECRGGTRQEGDHQIVRVRDTLTDAPLHVRARSVVNAAGCAMASVGDRVGGASLLERTRWSVALNVVVPAMPQHAALALRGRTGPDATGRYYFVVPWRERTLIGTAHLPYSGDPARFEITEADTRRFLRELQGVWPGRPITPDDVLLVHGGLLPLDEQNGLRSRHRIIDHGTRGAAGVISIESVKFSSARLAAEEAVDLVLSRLGRSRVSSSTASTLLPYAPRAGLTALLSTAHRRYDRVLGAPIVEHLVRSYGERYETVVGACARQPSWANRVSPAACVIEAQFHFGATDEMAQRPEDLIHRRTELGKIGVAGDHVVARATAALHAVSR